MVLVVLVLAVVVLELVVLVFVVKKVDELDEDAESVVVDVLVPVGVLARFA